MSGGRNLLQHQQWNYRHSHLIATSANPISFQVLYNLPVLSRQEQDTANLCPFPTLWTSLHHKILWRSCSTAPTFAVLRFEEWRIRQWLALCVQSERWWVQYHTITYSYYLAFWTVITDSRICFFVTKVLCCSVSASVLNLIVKGTVI